MTTANMLYLLMVIGVFFGFSAVLAYASGLQSRQGADFVGQPDRQVPPVQAAALSNHHPSLAA